MPEPSELLVSTLKSNSVFPFGSFGLRRCGMLLLAISLLPDPGVLLDFFACIGLGAGPGPGRFPFKKLSFAGSPSSLGPPAPSVCKSLLFDLWCDCKAELLLA